MFSNAFTGWHLVIILVIILLLFGAPKLPGLAKSIGQSMRIFKSEVKSMKDDGKAEASAADSASSPAGDVSNDAAQSDSSEPKSNRDSAPGDRS